MDVRLDGPHREAFFYCDKGGDIGSIPALLNNRPVYWPQKISKLILSIAAKIKEIFKLGRRYPWPKPEICPCCKQNRVWGHGYVLAYFDGFDGGIFLKRYRCPGCGCVIRLKPEGYLRRFQATTDNIRYRLSHRLRNGRWPPGCSRSRQGHWLRSLRRKVLAYLGLDWERRLLEGFSHLLCRGVNPVSRSI